MAYGKSIKKNFYSGGSGEIAMPAEGEMPPVLADSPSDWAGNNQQKEVPEQTHEEIENDEAAPDEVSAIEESKDEEEVIVQEEPKEVSRRNAENVRILREAREKAERERDELMKYVLQMKQAELPKQPTPVQEEEEEVNISFEDDALLEGKHGKQLYKKLQQMEKKLAQYESKNSESIVEAKIKAELPDFDAVVNQENISRLNQEFPEIATTLRDTKDLYSKATAAYKIMKKFGIYKDKSYDHEKEIALKNASKPRTVTSLNPQQGDSPLSKANAFANGMTKDLQAQLLKEMAAARKNL